MGMEHGSFGGWTSWVVLKRAFPTWFGPIAAT